MTSPQIGFLCGLIAALGMGCATTVNPTAKSFGLSHRQATTSQTLNPSASHDLKRVEGFNGAAAKLAMERYHKSFQDVPTQQQFVLRTGDLPQ